MYMKVDLNQLAHIDSKVKQIALNVEAHFNFELTLTSGFRPGDTGVHGVGRGLDFSCPDKYMGKLIEQYVNALYEYDYDRPEKQCCLYHNAGSGLHLHFQSHPNTRLR